MDEDSRPFDLGDDIPSGVIGKHDLLRKLHVGSVRRGIRGFIGRAKGGGRGRGGESAAKIKETVIAKCGVLVRRGCRGEGVNVWSVSTSVWFCFIIFFLSFGIISGVV